MKLKFMSLAVTIFLAGVLQGQTGAPKNNARSTPLKNVSSTPLKEDSTEASLLKLTREWVLAEDNKNQAALRQLIADDFMGTAVDGTRLNKEKLVNNSGPNSNVWSFTAADYTGRVFGDLGVVTGNGTWKTESLGQLSFTVIYKKRPQGWQIINLHISKIPE